MELIANYQKAFEAYCADQLTPREPLNLYEPVRYILSLGGKRFRPLFVLKGYELYQNDINFAMPAALAAEVFHNFTLMHDDIMDAADIRRGQPTVHQKYGVNTAILSGDVMLIKSYELLLSYGNPVLTSKLLNIFTKMATEVCEGQQMDMDFETADHTDIESYLKMITLKTSVLLAACFQMGAVLGGATESDQKHLYEFAKNFGIAFQLQDDVLDTFGNSDLVGKKIGGDIARNKKTYLYLKALELASDSQKNDLLNMYSYNAGMNENLKIQNTTSIFKELNVAEYASQTISAYRDLAVSHLQACNISEKNKIELIQMLDQMVFRSY
ncbi:MAG: polyprenyl synthetase family protein [Saprospiraceae bacterium]|nr:polyprenyl synthetase family protein [Saprospiraceae bacterium]